MLQPHNQSPFVRALVAAIGLLGIGALLYAGSSSYTARGVGTLKRWSAGTDDTQSIDSVGVTLLPRYEVLNGTEVVWQAAAGPARGVLFLAHGCQHGAVDFWPKSEACPRCLGLPEEMAIARTALARGYIVVAVSSMARDTHRCWDPAAPGEVFSPAPHDPNDTEKVLTVLIVLSKREGWHHLPLYAMGASSGGSFVLLLAMSRPFAGVCAQIMALPPFMLGGYEAMRAQNKALAPYPPTMFVHMPRDAATAEVVKADIQALKAANVPVDEARVEAAPLTPTTLHDRCASEITAQQSEAIYNALKKGGLLDESGKLVDDPRRSAWRVKLQEAGVPGIDSMRLQPDASPVSEVLNLLYAGHEIVSDTTGRMLDFFERHRQPHT